MEDYRRSANNQVRLGGGTVTASANPPGSADITVSGTTDEESKGGAAASFIADGREANYSGADNYPEASNRSKPGDTEYTKAVGANGQQEFTVTYSRPVSVHTVRAIFGRQVGLTSARVRWRNSENVWNDVPASVAWSRPLNTNNTKPYLLTDLRLPSTVNATGIQLVGTMGSNTGCVDKPPTSEPVKCTTLGELDALSPPGAGYSQSTPTGTGNSGNTGSGTTPTDSGEVTTIEGESLKTAVQGAPATAQVECCGLNWSAGSQLLVQSKDGDTVSITFTAPRAGKFDLILALTKANDFGNSTIKLNGRQLGTFTHGRATGFEVARQTYPNVDLTAGRNTLTFEIAGKLEASAAFKFGLDKIELRRRAG